MRTIEEQTADLARITAEELERRAKRLLIVARSLRDEAARLSEIVVAPRAEVHEPEPVAPERPEEPEEILEEPRLLRTKDSSVGRFGRVTLEIAQNRAQQMGEFTQSQFGERLGLKGAATMRWLSALIDKKVIRYRDGQYQCLTPPSMHHWAIQQTEPFDVEQAARVTRLSVDEAGEELGRLIAQGIIETINGSGLYTYVPPDPSLSPRERPRKTPPERTPPNYTMARATGMPVRRSAADKVTRRQRSTEGAGGIKGHKQRDRRYNEIQAVKEKRAAEQRAKDKAQYQPKGGRKKKGSTPV